ncbi:hypothetical protein ABPG75_006147 [Micractinium tetrahymenae]
MAAPEGGDCNLVQQLFEQRLGLLKPLPDAIAASSISTELREREQLRFKVARGVTLDYQAVPTVGSLLGMSYQPQRPLPRRTALQPPRQSAPNSPSASSSSSVLANGAAAAAAGAGAGAEGRDGPAPAAPVALAPPAQPPLWRPQQPQPAHATLWALVQPTPGLGVHTVLSAVDAGPTGFGGWHQDGFLDLTPRAGIDYSLARHPGSGVSAEVDLQATLPSLLLLPELTVQHRLAGAQAGRGMQHTSTVSAPLLRGAAVARLRAAEAASGAEGTLLTFELQGRGKRGARGLAGGAKLQAEHSNAFYGSSGCADSARSDSDDDEENSSNSRIRAGGGSSGEQQHSRRRVPGLRLQVAPAPVQSWEDVSGHWRQAWGGRLHSAVGYQGRQRRWNLELSSKLGRYLSAAGSLVCDGPPDAAALLAAACSDGDGADGASSEAGSSPRVQQLRQRAGAYLGAIRLCKAGVKLTCRLQRPARQHLHMETAMDEVATARRRLLVSARASSEPQDEWQTEVDWGKGATVFDSGHDSHEQSRGFGIIERPADPAVDGTPRWFVCDWDHQRAGARSKPIKQTYLELPLVPRHKRVAPEALQQRVLVILGNSKGKEGKTVQKCGGMWSVQLDGGKERQPFLPAYLHATAPPPADTTLNAFEPKVLTSLLAAEVPAYIERLRFAPDAPVDLHRKLPTSGCMMDLLTGAREVDSLSDQELRNLSGRAAGCPDKPSGSAEDPLTPAGRAAIADGLRQAVAGRWTIKMVCAQASTSSACGCPYALEFKHKGDGSVTVTQTEAHQFHDPSDAASLAKLKMHPALQAMGQVLLRCGVKPLQVCSELNAAALEDGVLGSGSSGLLMASNARGSITLDQVKALAKQVRRAQGLSVTSDSSALAAAVAAYREQGAVPFYQPYRAATKDTGEQPLIIILQTPWQARMLDQFGRTLTFADSTYGTNWAGYPLYACTVQDDVGRGVPAGFMICSSDTVEVVENFFRTLQEGAQKAGKEVGGKGDFKYGYIMIDKSSTEIAAVRQLVLTGDAKGHLLCYFHYLQDWERFVTSKVSGVSKEEKNGVMVAMADLQKCGSETVFKEQLKTLYHQYRRWPQVVAHLKKDWAPCGQEWAAWGEGRQDPRVAAMECETNNLCERAFGLVKYGDLGGKAQSSIPELVFVLLTRTVPRYMQQRAHQLVGRASSDQVQRSERVQRVVEKLASSGAVLPFPGEEEQGSKGFASVRCDTGGAMVCLGDMSCNCSYSEDHLCVHIKAAASVMSFTHQRRMAAAAFLVESGGIDVGEAGICTCATLADTSRKQTFRPQEGYCTCLDRQLHGTCAHLLAALLLEAFNGMELPQGPPQVAGEENKPIEISGPRTFQQASIEPLGERWQEEVKGLRAAKQASAVTIRQSQTNADPVIAEMRHSCAYVQRVVAALPADCEERAGLREGPAKLAEQAAAAEAALQLQPTAVRAGKQQRRQAGRHADDRVVKPLFPSRAKRGASLPAPAQPLAEEDRCDPLPRLTKRGKAVHKARGVTVPGNLDGTVLRNGAAHHRVPKRQRR